MDRTQTNSNFTIKVIGYLVLIISGWAVGQYASIPSFSLFGFEHIQPSIKFYDKAISITLFVFSLALYFALHKNYWLQITLLIMTWGMFGNMYDELSNKNGIFGMNEKISLLFVLLATTFLIYRKKKQRLNGGSNT